MPVYQIKSLQTAGNEEVNLIDAHSSVMAMLAEKLGAKIESGGRIVTSIPIDTDFNFMAEIGCAGKLVLVK